MYVRNRVKVYRCTRTKAYAIIFGCMYYVSRIKGLMHFIIFGSVKKNLRFSECALINHHNKVNKPS